MELELKEFSQYILLLDKIEVVRHGKVRRSKLYYLRTAKGKKAKLKKKDFAAAIADKPAEEQAVEATSSKTPAEETKDRRSAKIIWRCAGGEMADALP